jgi:hypothetical protein
LGRKSIKIDLPYFSLERRRGCFFFFLKVSHVIHLLVTVIYVWSHWSLSQTSDIEKPPCGGVSAINSQYYKGQQQALGNVTSGCNPKVIVSANNILKDINIPLT